MLFSSMVRIRFGRLVVMHTHLNHFPLSLSLSYCKTTSSKRQNIAVGVVMLCRYRGADIFVQGVCTQSESVQTKYNHGCNKQHKSRIGRRSRPRRNDS